MRLHIPDPDYTSSKRAKSSFVLAVKLGLIVLAVVWLSFFLQLLIGPEMAQMGLRPRSVDGLLGLLTTPLLHGSFAHLLSNSVPLFVGIVAMLFLYPNSSLRVLPILYVGSAALAWIFGRSSVHIGASGLVYGLLSYVFLAGLLRRDLRSVGVSLMVWFFYGSMVWGVLPLAERTSWELHASGFLLGLLTAWIYRDWDRPPVKTYDWELEDIEQGDDEYPNDRNWPGMH
jgi:membrane associated rhomboid family serine protease